MTRQSERIAALIDGVLTGPGTTEPELRQTVAARAGALSGGQGVGAAVPDELSDWVAKVAQHAYKTTDQDVASLRAAGYSEDQIFEVTVAAAVGASRARLERALDALSLKDEG